MAETATWTIKNMPIAARRKAIDAANRQDQRMAEWLSHAIDRLADQQGGTQILPPAPAVPASAPASEIPDIDLPGLAQAIQATVEASVAAGRKPPAGLAREAAATLRLYMRAARGLPARQTRQTDGQTGRLIHGKIEDAAPRVEIVASLNRQPGEQR
jgi:hypothetical protein